MTIENNDRSMGRRGLATRRKFLDAAAKLLDEHSYRDVTVTEIAKEAGTSPATFYQYFSDVEDVVLALADELVSVAATQLATRVRNGNWESESAWESALSLSDAFIALWASHRSVLRLIDLANDEGDSRFREVRTRLLAPTTNALVDVLQKRKNVADPLAEAGVLVSMLAHVAAHEQGLQSWGASPNELRRSMARILYVTLTGQLSPS
ncbi:MAG: hypothetical protein RLZZ31_1272 [Actinomycetota bacterium]|jgi:AcrR family transcriptional regulator